MNGSSVEPEAVHGPADPRATRGPRRAMNIRDETLEGLVAAAARAPSIHNTQPWHFSLTGDALELRADHSRRLLYADPDARELLISCGAALFGLRLGVSQLGNRPVVELLPRPARLDVLARVRFGAPAPIRTSEQLLWSALRRRHTHRGSFADEPMPPGLLTALRRDAEAEDATLVFVREPEPFEQLATLVTVADLRQREFPAATAEVLRWTRRTASRAGDGVPARAYSVKPAHRPQTLAQRDFDLGRGWGLLGPVADAPVVTAVLTTPGDGPADWLRAGQALHRLLLRAAADWVFATMHSQALEVAPVRSALRAQLRLPGAPQMVLQLGRARTAPLTPRRPVSELLIPR